MSPVWPRFDHRFGRGSITGSIDKPWIDNFSSLMIDSIVKILIFLSLVRISFFLS